MIDLHLAYGEATIDAASALASQEAALLGPRTSPKRRADFLRGRLVAKGLLAQLLPASSWQDFVVLPDSRGVPIAYDRALSSLPYSLTISHTQGIALAATSHLPILVGADVERFIERPQIVVDDYFTSLERSLTYQGSAERTRVWATCIWALKEAALKALGDGLRRSTQSIEVYALSPSDAYAPALMRCDDGTKLVASLRVLPEGAVGVCCIGMAEETLSIRERIVSF